MSEFRKLTETVFASPQINPGDLTSARAQGVRLVINNRPDGEEPGQPTGEEIAGAARAEGLEYVAIPVDRSGFSPARVEAMAHALERAEGKVLAYCRSGTRSTFLWALASASRGAEPGRLVEAAELAGYDLSSIRSALDGLAARSPR